MSKVIHLTNNSLEALIENKETFIVDFWAEWCGPCKKIGPILDELSEELSIKITKINVDQEPEIARKYMIRSIPTIIIFKNGEKQQQIIGAYSKMELKEKIDHSI